MNDDWNTDFVDLVDAFNAHGVEYVVVGAFALAQHGLLRATSDLDIAVRPTPENAKRVVAALSQFGAPLASVGVGEADFASPGKTYQMGIKPRRVDLLTELSGVSWDEVAGSCMTREVLGRAVPFASVEALKQNKRASGRPKDLADVAWLDATFPSPR